MPELKKAELINGIVYIPSPIDVPNHAGIRPLQNGDHLTIEEFERRYEAMPEVKKAELINGVVYMGSPVSLVNHGSPHSFLTGWLVYYHAFTPGTQTGDNATLKLPIGTHRPQPDDLLRILPEHGGRSRTDSKGYVVGGVELAAEIAASSANIDLHEKKTAYELNGILEYLVWRVEDDAIDWFILKRGSYQRLRLTGDGLYKSKVFPGLWLDPQAMITGDVARVIEIVQQGIASPEHERFVEKLRSKKK
ncbi:MAG: Uma2 family endonuclease [Planctomycetes bacterium]|nr:Uma2 family endonuclease [Planctomycetota bacterium]